MRVLLVRPPVPRQTIGLKNIMVCEPLELEYVAAGLDGHEVRILDLILEHGFLRTLREFRPDVVGTSCYITGVNEVIKLCRAAKRWNPGVLTVVGGVQASLAPEDFADPSVDCIVPGDGTTIMPEILRAREGGRLEDVPGLALPDGADVRRTAVRDYMPDPDSLPFPRRDLVGRLARRYYYLHHRPVATVKTTWGCWYRCNFCFTWRITGGSTHSRSPESIADEIERIATDEIYIVDDIFLIDRKRLSALAELLRRRGIRKNYLVYGRADFIAHNESVIEEWAALGLKAVLIGLEAATNPELESMDKRTTVDENREAIAVLRRHRVDTYGSVIAQPDYRPEDWRRLREFVDETGLYYLNLSPLTPLPGTDAWNLHRDRLTVSRRAHGLWDLSHVLLPTAMPLKDYYRSLLGVYAHAALDPRRAARLPLRTMPRVGSPKFLRLWAGALRIAWQLLFAHRHHHPRQIAQAESRGPAAPARALAGPAASAAVPASAPPPASGVPGLPRARRWLAVVRRAEEDGLYTYQLPREGRSGRRVRAGGRSLLQMSSYDYLGLLGHPAIDAAAVEAVRAYGTGAGGVRMLTGTTRLHEQLEQEIAGFRGAEAALTFSSGYAANLAAVAALAGPGDHVLVDARVHRSTRDGCRVSGASVAAFRHNDPGSLERLLRRGRRGRALIVVEGVYSMDGDVCPLPEVARLRDRYGALLLVDEAHSLGVLGATGGGVAEHFGLPAESADLWMGCLSKAIPSAGGFLAGSRDAITYLRHEAGPYFYSAALPPPAAAAARAALDVIRAEPWRVRGAAANGEALRAGLRARGHDTGASSTVIVPVLLGSRDAALRAARSLLDDGILASAIVPPAIAEGKSRLRLCAMATHTESDYEQLFAALDSLRGSRGAAARVAAARGAAAT